MPNPNRKVMDDEITQFFEALGVDVMSDVIYFAVSLKMNSQQMGVYSYEEFKSGCLEMKCDSVDRWKIAV